MHVAQVCWRVPVIIHSVNPNPRRTYRGSSRRSRGCLQRRRRRCWSATRCPPCARRCGRAPSSAPAGGWNSHAAITWRRAMCACWSCTTEPPSALASTSSVWSGCGTLWATGRSTTTSSTSGHRALRPRSTPPCSPGRPDRRRSKCCDPLVRSNSRCV